MNDTAAQPASEVGGPPATARLRLRTVNIDIRRAIPNDHDAIVALVRSERLNPTGLHWPRFVVAADDDGRVVGAVQLRQHTDGARELGSLVVTAALRGQGVAARMIDALLAGQPGTVHMITAATHAERYALWGFEAIEPRQAPRSVRRNHLLGGLARVLTWLRGLPPRRLVILERDTARPQAARRCQQALSSRSSPAPRSDASASGCLPSRLLLHGTLRVTLHDGRARQFGPGEAFAEAGNTAHYGRNAGACPSSRRCSTPAPAAAR